MKTIRCGMMAVTANAIRIVVGAVNEDGASVVVEGSSGNIAGMI